MLGMEPGVQTAGNKSAATRFNNDRSRAAQLSMQNNLSAQRAFKPQQNGSTRRVKAPVGTPQQPLQAPQQFPELQGGPQGSQGGQLINDQQVNPVDMELESILNNIKMEKFLSHPQVQQAVTKTRLQEYFQRNKPNKDLRPLADKVFDNLISFG